MTKRTKPKSTPAKPLPGKSKHHGKQQTPLHKPLSPNRQIRRPQKQPQEFLGHSEDRFRRIAQISFDVIFMLDPEGRITYISPTVEQTVGFSPEFFIGKHFREFIVEADLPKAVQAFRKALTGKATSNLELRTLQKSGPPIYAEYSYTPFYKNGKLAGMEGVARDITQRKKAQEELAQLSARYQAMLTAVPDIIMEVDSNRVYTWANQAGLDFFGDDVIGRQASNYFVGEQDTYRKVNALFHGDENVFYLESWQRRKDGQNRLLAWWCRVLKEDHDKVTGALSTARDITEHKQAELALREAKQNLETRVKQRTADLAQTVAKLEAEAKERTLAEQRLDAERLRLFSVLQMLPGYVALHDQRYLIPFCNDKFLQLFGQPAGRRCYEFIKGRQTVCESCPVIHIFDTHQPEEWEWQGPDKRTYHSWGYPFADADGTQLVLELGIDITDRKLLQQEVLRISESERQRISQDLHDGLGQILSGLSCLSQALHHKLQSRSAQEAPEAAKINTLLADASELTRSLARGLNPVPADPEGLVEALAELASNTDQMFNVKCTFRCHGKISIFDPVVAGNLYWIAQEAVHNAVRHSQARRVVISLEDAAGQVLLKIEDDGQGLPQNIPPDKGLGLRIIKYRAESIGAVLSLQSGPQNGTTVACRLRPASRQQNARLTQIQPRAKRQQKRPQSNSPD